MRAFYPVEFKLQRVWASASRARATGVFSLIYIKLAGLHSSFYSGLMPGLNRRRQDQLELL